MGGSIIHLDIHLKNIKQNELILPIHYNYLVQAALYNSIDQELAEFLHQKGYIEGKRSFKMFTFSLLQGPYRLDGEKKTICFEDKIRLTVSSPFDEFLQSLVNVLLTKGTIRLGSAELEIAEISAAKQLVDKEEIVIRTLSPIVVYSTMLRPDNRKYTVYFQPGDPDYQDLIQANLHRKYKAFYAEEPPEGKISIKPLGLQRMKIIKYKNYVIKGYAGKLELTGPIPLLQLAVDGGLGSKNSQGFGCVELLRRERI